MLYYLKLKTMPSWMQENPLVFEKVTHRAQRAIMSLREALSNLQGLFSSDFSACVAQVLKVIDFGQAQTFDPSKGVRAGGR